MFFRKKIRRVVDVKKAEDRFEQEFKDVQLEKKDRPAMIIAALIVFVPALLLVLAIFLLILYLFFFRFL